jgi:hypothetical protein
VLLAAARPAVAQVPTLSSLQPGSANNTAPVAVTITGTGFNTATTVTLTGPVTRNVTSSDFAVIDDLSLVAVFPLDQIPAGTYNVGVTNASGPSSNTLPFVSTVGAPEVDSISPGSGANSVAVAVEIAGRFFDGVTAVQLVGPVTRNLPFTVGSSTSISATVAAGLPAGGYRVRVTATAGASNDDVTYTVVDTSTQATLAFTDAFGNAKSSFVIGTDQVFLTLVDRDKDTDPTSQQTVNVTLTDSITGDLEVLTLAETANSSGVFRNVGVNTVRAAAVLRNGILESQPGATITGSYRDVLFTAETATATAVTLLTSTTSATTFTNSTGGAQFNYDIAVDRIFVTVTDADRNQNSGVAETVGVTVTDPNTGDSEILTLVETGVNTGAFRNTTGVASIRAFTGTPGNGVLETVDSSNIRADYTDPGNSSDRSFSVATMHDRRPASIRLTDAVGNTQTSYVIGQTGVFVTVTDLDVNFNPNLAERVDVVLTVSGTNDRETVQLVETGLSTGTFRNQTGVTSRLGAAAANGILDAQANAILTAAYTDAHDPPDQVQTTAILRPAPTASSLVLTDATGATRTEFRIGAELIFVTVTDADENENGSVVETVTASLVDTRTGDTETLTLSETSANSGVFRNLTGVPSAFGTAQNNNGTVETANLSTLTGNYRDNDDPSDSSAGFATMRVLATRSNTFFSDTAGNPRTQYVIAAGDVFVTVQDFDRNTDPASRQTVFVTLRDAVTADSEIVSLVETDNNTGAFRNTVGFATTLNTTASAVPNNNVLELRDGDTATATYNDPDNPPDTSSAAALFRFITPSTTFFSDRNGIRKGTFIIGVEDLFVTVIDRDEGSTTSPPPTVRTVRVSIQDPVTGDVKTLTLTEDPVVLGTFRNTTGFPMVKGVATPGDPTRLYAAGNSTLVATYADPSDNSDTSSGTALARTPVTAGVMFFSDQFGAPVSEVQISAGLFVTLVDENSNHNAGVTEQVTVTLIDGSTGDAEVAILRETGASTGRFRNVGAFPMRVALPIGSNGVLESADGSILSANFRDPDDGELVTAFATARRGTDPGANRIARFTNVAGTTVATFDIADAGNPVFVTIEEPDANLNATVADSVTVTIRDTNPAQPESLVLVATEINLANGQLATNTGVFRNVTGVLSRLATPPLINNTLEVLADDFLTIDYRPRSGLPPTVPVQPAQMKIKPGNSTLTFSDATGTPRSQFTIGAQPLFVTLTDADENRNPGLAETAVVSLISTITGDVEGTVTLVETGPNTGVFRNATGVPTLIAAAANNDGRVQTAAGAIVTANYTDRDDANDRSVATAQMLQEELPATRLEFRTGTGPGATTTSTYQVFTTGRDQAFLILEDRDANTNPLTVQSVPLSLVASGTPLADTETVTLSETGANTGVFESTAGVPIDIAPAAPANGRAETRDGGGLLATYRDPENPGDFLQAVATVSIGRLPVTTVFFSDSAGVNKPTFIAGVDAVFISVNDRDQNRNPAARDTVRVTLSSLATGDTLPINLTETDVSTGIFRNTAGVSTAVAAAAADGVLQVATEADIFGLYVDPRNPSDTATARARMKPNPQNSITRFTDQFGNTRSSFTIGGEFIFVTVTDPDQNRNPAVADTVPVSLTSTITGDALRLTLLETTPVSGEFRNTAGVPSIVAAANPANTIFETAGNDSARATYVDPSTPADTSFTIATMVLPRSTSVAAFIRSVGSSTTTAAFEIGTQLVFIRVSDADQLRDPTRVETLRVTLRNEQTADEETVTLTEVSLTGAASAAGARFESLTGVPTAIALPATGNGTLESNRDSIATVTYVDPQDATDRAQAQATLRSPFAQPTIILSNQAGTKVTTYTIGAPTGVFVTVTDPQANRSASTSVRDTVATTIFDQTTGDVVALTLFELPDAGGVFSTGLFRNPTNLASEVGLPPTPVTTTLFTADNSTIIASYFKPELSGEPPTIPTTQKFDPTIARILTGRGPNGRSCFECHSDDNVQGLLNITGFRDLTRGGVRGNAVMPGNSQASLIVRKLEPASVNPLALPHPEPGVGDPALKVGGVISQGDLNTLKAWIDEGARPPTLPTSTTYDRVQAQVFTPSCVNRPAPSLPGCHDPTFQAGGIRLNDLSGFLDSIRQRQAALLGNGPGSRMIQVLNDQTGTHPVKVRPDQRITGPQDVNPGAGQLLSIYLSQQYPGAPNPPLREYTPDVQPYFDRNCTTSGCHNRRDRAGGLDLTSFAGLNMGGTNRPAVTPGDVPPALLKRKIDRLLEPTHTASISAVSANFFTSAGPAAITSWVNQGAFPGSLDVASTPPVGAVTDTAVMKVGPTTAAIQFTDGAGAAVPFYRIAEDLVFVTVTDSNRNRSPTTAETLDVTLVDGRTGDSERFVLTELSTGSSRFRNRSGIPSVVGGATTNDGVLQTTNNATVTATYTDSTFTPAETVSARVTMSTNTRSTVRFVDTLGLPVGSIFIGTQPVIVEVNDGDNSGRGRLDPGAVTLTVSPTSDLERLTLIMMEVTGQPGVFRSQALPTTLRVTSTRENGLVEAVHRSEVTASYTDTLFPTDTSTATALMRIAPVASEVSFTDQFGTTKTAFAAEGELVFVTVRDANRNLSATTTDVIDVTLFVDQLGDNERVVLSEVGRNSGIFRNTTGVPSRLANLPTAGSGTLEVRDTGVPTVPIRCEYVDTDAPPDARTVFADLVLEGGSTVLFTNSQGTPISRYVRGRDLIFVTVIDANRNRNPAVAETINATVTDSSIAPPDRETLILVETGPATGVFRNPSGLRSVFGFPVAIPENRVFETRVNSVANPGEVITAGYQDPAHPGDTSATTAEMVPTNPDDSDDDRMPDSFENANGLNPLDPTDAGLDFDADGFTNLEEFLNGTDPRNPFDNKPVADAGSSRSVDPGVIQLDGSASRDPRNRPLTYRWTQVLAGAPGHGPAVALSDARAVRPTFVGFGGRDRNGNDFSLFEFDLVVANVRVNSNPSRIVITVNNVPPSPFAGIGQAMTLGESITLNGRESADANNETRDLAYSWSRPVGSGGFNAAIASPVVQPQLVGTYDFALTATDPAGNSAASNVFVVVHQAANHVPLASAPRRVAGTVGQSVAIDGTASADADPGDVLTYHWRVTRAPAGAGLVTPIPADSTIGKTNIVPPRAGFYEVTLFVTDQNGNASPPVVTGLVADFPGAGAAIPDRTPVAAAGPNQVVQTNGTVTLDGRASRDPDGQALTYRWTQTRGVRVGLSSNAAASPSFIPFFPGVYGFELVVSDGANDSPPAEVFVTANAPGQRIPKASAGTDQRATLTDQGVLVVLDGTASTDADGDRLTYYWRQVSGPGVALGNRESSRPTLFTRQPGTYTFELVVFDQKNFSLPSRVAVQVNPSGIGAPVAVAGAPQTIYFVDSPVTVQLDGRGSSDPQGLPLAYSWTQLDGPPVVLSPGADVAAPSFVATAIAAYRFQLVVRNTRGAVSLPSVTIVTVVNGANEPPAVRLNGSGGASATVKTLAGVPVTMDASASSARSGGALTFVWRQVSGPPVILANPASSSATFTPALPGAYVFSVTVVDRRANQGTGTVSVFVGDAMVGGGSTGGVGGPGGSGGGGGGARGPAADPGAIAERGGGGGGCIARRPGGAPGPIDPFGLAWILVLWIALVARRWAPGLPGSRSDRRRRC